jgi:thiamine pyrophosphate-dependent acetolactate synthase large subunit-like protein
LAGGIRCLVKNCSAGGGGCFIITCPGLTNITTVMDPALADSIPMLVISNVNRRNTQGRLHSKDRLQLLVFADGLGY